MREVAVSLNILVVTFAAFMAAKNALGEFDSGIIVDLDQSVLELHRLWCVLDSEDKVRINNYRANEAGYAGFTLEDLLLVIFAHTPGIVFLPPVYERIISHPNQSEFSRCIPFLLDSIRKVIEAHPDLFLSEQERRSIPASVFGRNVGRFVAEFNKDNPPHLKK